MQRLKEDEQREIILMSDYINGWTREIILMAGQERLSTTFLSNMKMTEANYIDSLGNV